jgi:hypothetical protein
MASVPPKLASMGVRKYWKGGAKGRGCSISEHVPLDVRSPTHAGIPACEETAFVTPVRRGVRTVGVGLQPC